MFILSSCVNVCVHCCTQSLYTVYLYYPLRPPAMLHVILCQWRRHTAVLHKTPLSGADTQRFVSTLTKPTAKGAVPSTVTPADVTFRQWHVVSWPAEHKRSDEQTDRQSDRQSDRRPTDRQTVRQTNRILFCLFIYFFAFPLFAGANFLWVEKCCDKADGGSTGRF